MFIETTGLVKEYVTGEVRAQVLRGVELGLERGGISVILGPSGSGKSTLLNIIGGVDRADAGRVTVDGVDVTALSDGQLTEYRRDKVGFVFQFYNLVPNLTVQENVEVVANISKQPLKLREVLEAVDLWDKRARFPRELSGGEQQRVSIARAVVKRPALLLCDEPTGALDYMTSRSVLALLQRVNATFGTTVLMITHNSAIVAMVNVVLRLRDGEITETLRNEVTLPAERIEW